LSFELELHSSRLTGCAPLLPRGTRARGTQKSKKKVTDLDVVGWFLGGQKSTRAGQVFFRDFFIVFLNSPHRETPKNVMKTNREKIGFGFFWSIFLIFFSTRFFVKRFL
jgi:hypothetical protein